MNHRIISFLFLLSATLFLGSGVAGAANGKTGGQIEASARIDQLISKNHAAQEITPNPPADDAVFVRRIYLDLIGRIPTRQETVDFLESKDPDKRSALINVLLDSDGYVSHQFNYWADLLRAKTQISGNGQSTPAGLAYAKWIKDSLQENKPYDEFVREMLAASGSTWTNPAIGYYLRDYGMPLDNLAITTQVFLGTQIVCAQCHDHPFDSWSQMDYYHLSAFTYGMVTTNQSPNQREAIAFAKKGAKKPATEDENARRTIQRAFSEILKPVRFNNVVATERRLRLPHDYQYDDAKPKSPVEPAVPFAPGAAISGDENPIHAFAAWVTSPENPRFTKVIANRLWKKAFGAALIEPADDMRDDTEASNPELMAYLEEQMIALDYDLKAFLRMIYNTETYQREASPAELTLGVTYHFPGPLLRRMSAEQIWDSLVAMAIDNPDQPDPEMELTTKRRIAEVELIANAVYDQKPGEFLRNAYEVAQVQKQLADQFAEVQEKLAAARESKDLTAIRETNQKSRQIRRQLALQIEEKVYREGLEERFTQVALNSTGDNDEAFLNQLAATLQEHGDSPADGMEKITGARDGIVRQLVDAIMADDEAELEAREDVQKRTEVREWQVRQPDEKTAYRNFVSARKNLKRASDLPSPAPLGHFLREFGQSDRELVENANDQASITQALALLNGPALSAIAGRYSVLGRDLRENRSFTDRLDTIFLTMLNRPSTPDEQEILKQAWSEADGAGSVQGLVWTVLNMREFLFIQ